MDDYEQYDALGLAELIRRGDVSATEALEAAITRAEARNPAINAIVTPMYDRARDDATEPCAGAFSGVPFLVKDITYVEGVRCTMGSRLFQHDVPDHDAEIVSRHRHAGLVLFGKTNTPEVGLAATTESLLLGPCRNPWNTDRTPGGSSGGAAAAVAAGIVPAAHATDGGGSIRIPASCCGLVGLKPSRGRTPLGPDVAEGWGSMSTGHAVTRSVRDSAALLDATHGPAPGDPYHAPHFADSYLDVLQTPPPRLRIALDLDPLSGGTLHAENRRAAEQAARLCEDLGHTVEPVKLPIDDELPQATSALVLANVANTILTRTEALERAATSDDVEKLTLEYTHLGQSTPAHLYARSVHAIHRASRRMAEFMSSFDLIVSPTLLQPPVPVGWLVPNSNDLDTYGNRFVDFWGFTSLYNATGQPAISLPLAWSTDGLPIGIQFAARYGEEDLLLQFAAEIEQAQPWANRRAPMTDAT